MADAAGPSGEGEVKLELPVPGGAAPAKKDFATAILERKKSPNRCVRTRSWACCQGGRCPGAG
jgi:hypothetical protein